MKKTPYLKLFYYLLPFAVVPGAMILCELLDNAGIVQMSPILAGGLLLLLSALLGFCSFTEKEVDVAATVLMPLSLFVFMFLVGLLDGGDLGTRFSIDRALSSSLSPLSLTLYVLMASVTLFASLRIFRKGMHKEKS